MSEKEKQYTFLEILAHAFNHREIVTYEDKVQRDQEKWEERKIILSLEAVTNGSCNRLITYSNIKGGE
jgi:hypothetical protein